MPEQESRHQGLMVRFLRSNSRAFEDSESASDKSFLASSRTYSPFALSDNLLRLRLKRETPKSSSRFFIVLLSAGWDKYRNSAASDRVPVSAKATNCRNSYNSIIIFAFSISLTYSSMHNWHCTFEQERDKIKMKKNGKK